MKAVGFTQFGGPEVLRVVELPEPQAGRGQVRIRVAAADVNPSDILIRSGFALRDHPEYPSAATTYVTGWDAAGVIDQIGEGVRDELALGMPALALVAPRRASGAHAEFVVAAQESVVRAPTGVDLTEASTLLMNALTARTFLDALDLAPGATIAVTGAAGALGGYSVELAKQAGFTVIADASAADTAVVAGFGADHVLARGPRFAERTRRIAPAGVDGMIDAALVYQDAEHAVRDGAIVATAREPVGPPSARGVRRLCFGVQNHVHRTDLLEELRDQAAAGVLTLRVAGVFELGDAADAHRLLEKGGVRGRPVLAFG
ncbi:NADP-dependent oxidoreductase [Nocardia sp. NPDC051756]|uniref:NADP-dependent oxidoreductase n=1 Tax=Nocardia sp. NPDC051756 TaxID=3154751 RepID=UPI00343239A3